MGRKHHHIVSEGYQRLFATPDGIRLIDKDTMTARIVGTKGAFARKHFSSYLRNGSWSDELEDEWADRESYALPYARSLKAGRRRDAESRHAMKVLAALHYVRSYAFEEMLRRIMLQELEVAPGRIANAQHARAAFESDFDRPPDPGEIEQLVIEQWTTHHEGRTFLISQMAEGFNKTLDILRPLQVQLIWPEKRQVDFVFADGPLVHWGRDGRLTALNGVALGDADTIFFPLGPRLAACFTSRTFVDCPVTVDQVQWLNRRSWQASMRMLGAHPSTNVKRSLLQWNLKLID
jgi:hypothetical protein